MPFTFCHPALILPLTKINANRISATGLIIGSMSPDFEYFIKMRMEKIHGHHLGGLFYFDLPLTLLLAILFHALVRDTLILSSPEFVRKKYMPFVGMNWIFWLRRHWFVFLYSALIGIFSHIFWDGFTHTNGYFVQHIPFLQGSTEIFGVHLKKADLAQTLSTLFGGLILLLAVILPPSDALNKRQFRQKMNYWIYVVLILTLILLLRNIQTLGDFVATFISGGLIGLIIAPMLLKQQQKGNKNILGGLKKLNKNE